MPFSKLNKFLKNTAFCIFLTVLISGCGNVGSIFDPKPPIEPEARKRARQNAEEGKGIGVFGKKNQNTNYQFATSNPMWRATLDTLDFLPLTTVDYSGGVVITDWYSESSSNEALKITVRFLSTDIRADGIKIIVHKKVCSTSSNCTTNISKSNLIKDELRSTILRKASLLEKSDKNKK